MAEGQWCGADTRGGRVMRLIDADTLINELNNNRYPGAPYVDTGISIAIGKVCDAPTIEERKTGKWEEREVSSEKVIDEWQSARCSVCGKYHTTPYMYFFHGYNYCPNCGARMVSDEDRSD